MNINSKEALAFKMGKFFSPKNIILEKFVDISQNCLQIVQKIARINKSAFFIKMSKRFYKSILSKSIAIYLYISPTDLLNTKS